MHVFPVSVISHVCAVSFVSSLAGSKSWEHNGPCLGPDNRLYEWQPERRRGEEGVMGEEEEGLQETHCVCDTFHKALSSPCIYLFEKTQRDHSHLAVSAGVKWQMT